MTEIILKIGGKKVHFESLTLKDVIGDISSLTGEVSGTNLELYDPVVLKDGNHELFSGYLIKTTTEGGRSNILCYSQAWRLRGMITNLHIWRFFFLYEFFYGMRREHEDHIGEGEIGEITTEQSLINIQWLDSNDPYGAWDDIVRITTGGYIKGVHVVEDMNLYPEVWDDNKNEPIDIMYSQWIKAGPSGGPRRGAKHDWDEITFMHMTDQSGYMVYPLRRESFPYDSDYVRIYNYNTLLGELSYYVPCLANEDPNSPIIDDLPPDEAPHRYYANGLLYKTGLILHRDISNEVFFKSQIVIEEDNVLDALRSLCSHGLVWLLGVAKPFQVHFWLNGNDLYVKEVKDTVVHTLKDDNIMDAHLIKDMRGISNKITYVTDRVVEIRYDEESMERYGQYAASEELALSPAECNKLIDLEFAYMSNPQVSLEISTTNKFINVADKIRVKSSNLSIDNVYVVRELTRNISPYGVTTTLSLSDTPTTEITRVLSPDEMKSLFIMYMNGVKKGLKAKHRSYEMVKIRDGRGTAYGFDSTSWLSDTAKNSSGIYHEHRFHLPYSTQITFE